MSSKRRGQAIVELTLALPLMLFFTFASFQLVLLLLAYLSVTNAARDAARWVATYPHTTDANLVTAVRSRLPPNIDPARLSVTMSPACLALQGGRCNGRNRGDRVSVTLAYDASSVIFLPTRFGWGDTVVQMPTGLPAYTLHMMVLTA